MTLTVPAAAFPVLTGDDLVRALDDATGRAFGTFFDDYHRYQQIARFTSVIETVTPDEYALLWRSLKMRDGNG